jgi:transposase, IS5 family
MILESVELLRIVSMSTRQTGQMSFVEAGVHRRKGLNDELDRISALIDWTLVQQCLSPLEPARRGAPGYPALMLFKAVLLAQWNGLSDEVMERMLADRWSFQRFCGHDPSTASPDHSTLWRFREAMAEAGIADVVFAEINRQLDGHGLILRKGTLVDATLVEAQAARPKPPKDQAPVPSGEKPKSLLVKSKVDPDAGWTRRGSVHHFGYKGHIGVDQGSGIIRSQSFTSAEVNETTVADNLIMGDETAVYADKAYDSHARTQQLKAKGIKCRIQRRANKHHSLSDRDTRRNTLIGKVRGRVETVFAHLKRIVGYRHVRYFNKMRNAAQFALLCTAYNLFKAVRMT